jgi:hypothetical protein
MVGCLRVVGVDMLVSVCRFPLKYVFVRCEWPSVLRWSFSASSRPEDVDVELDVLMYVISCEKECGPSS